MKPIDVPFANPWRNVMSSGQPALHHLEAAAQSGYTMVIDLRCEGEFTEFDESAAVERLGMRYLRIPVNGQAGVTEANARALQMAIAEAGGEPVLCHCGTGNRVGALVALGAWLDGADAAKALAEGRSAGLVGLEPFVAGLMAQG